jgi:hypothetical protein
MDCTDADSPLVSCSMSRASERTVSEAGSYEINGIGTNLFRAFGYGLGVDRR